MTMLLIILLILASVILGLIVLIQNPKGGGLAGSMAGLSNQFMGVKQTNDILEKGTWLFAAVIAVLCITSGLFIRGGSTSRSINVTGPAKQSTPANNYNSVPFQQQPAAPNGQQQPAPAQQ